jgi:mycothiol synthase
MTEELPQLAMRRQLANLPDLMVPPGYALRPHAPNDLSSWTQLMSENQGWGEWPLGRSTPWYGSDSPVIFSSSYFITRDGEPVATAHLSRATVEPIGPPVELGWVATAPRYQGRGLARTVCLAVLHAAAAAGYSEISLRTEDYRVPAIHVYLTLGFEPWLYEPTAAERWRAIRAQIAAYQLAKVRRPAPESP